MANKTIPIKNVLAKTKPVLESEKMKFLDDVYHSSSAEEMQIKIAASGKSLDSDDVAWLIETMCYHAALWPHTLFRWRAFMKLLKIDKEVRKAALTDKNIEMCISKVSQPLTDAQIFSMRGNDTSEDVHVHFKDLVPGLQMETYYWSATLTILLKLRLKTKLAHDVKFAKKERD